MQVRSCLRGFARPDYYAPSLWLNDLAAAGFHQALRFARFPNRSSAITRNVNQGAFQYCAIEKFSISNNCLRFNQGIANIRVFVLTKNTLKTFARVWKSFFSHICVFTRIRIYALCASYLAPVNRTLFIEHKALNRAIRGKTRPAREGGSRSLNNYHVRFSTYICMCVCIYCSDALNCEK